MKRRRPLIVVAVLLCCCCYLAGPWIAGSYRIGNRLGPVFYPESFHQVVYILAHESTSGEKPRVGPGSWMYDRPLFYGLPQRLKSSEERQAFIEKMRQNGSSSLDQFIMMNRIAESGGSTEQVEYETLKAMKEDFATRNHATERQPTGPLQPWR